MLYITLPKKLQNNKQVIVYRWLTEVGAKIEKDQAICSVHISQEIFEIKSSVSGYLLKEMVAAGGVFNGADPMAVIGEKGEDISELEKNSDISIENKDIDTKTPVKKVKTEPKPDTKSQAGVKNMSSYNNTSAAEGDVIPILMPQAGQSMEEGTIVSWKVAEGDRIEVGQVIMEIETDKAVMEVEAVDAGRIAKIVSREGDIVEVKEPVAYLAEEGVDVSGNAAAVSGETAAPTASSVEPSAPAAAVSGETAAPAASSVEPSAPAAAVSGETAAPAASSVEPSAPAATAMQDGEVTPVLMPQAGQSMEEGTIVSWKVAEGDRIEVGQVIMEIETDKAVMEVEAVDAGRIAKILSQEGDIVEVKEPVAYLAEEGIDVDGYIAAGSGGSAAPASPAASADTKQADQQRGKAASSQQATAAQTSETGRVKASPAARKAAAEAGISLSSINFGSGPSGRVLSTDVANAENTATEDQIIPLTKMRRAIAKNLQYSKQNVPHFYMKGTIDAAKLFDTYKATKQEFKCSVNDFVTMACAKAIRQHPAFRSQYIDDQIIAKPLINIGIAVGTDDGLTVPVVCGIDRMTLEKLASRTREVVESARSGKMEGAGQGIFTITNLGMFGTEEFSAIINPPEAAILAVGAIREDIMVKNGAIIPTRVMTMTLSVDHRVVDGVLAAQFMNSLKELLENPEKLL